MLRKSYSVIVAIMFMLSEAPDVFAWGMDSYGLAISNEPCLFTTQMQDPLFKRQYVSKLIAAVQGNKIDSPTPDDMYNDIRKASIEENDAGGFNIPDEGGSGAMESFEGIDNLSIICLSCHNGVTAQLTRPNVKNDPYNRTNSVSSKKFEHPIGMDYAQYASSGSGFKQINMNSTTMIFVDGKVGCLTCHDPINPERNHLVMSDSQSALCLTCHDK